MKRKIDYYNDLSIKDSELADMIKQRIALYRRHLVSLDDLLGYLYCMHDLTLINSSTFTMIIEYIVNGDECSHSE